MKKSIIVIFFILIVFSCKTVSVNDLSIPSEKKIEFKNIAIEYYSIAEAYFELKKYEKAAFYYELAMRQDDLKTASYFKLGKSYALAQKWAEAEKIYKNLLKADSENISLKMSLAYIYAMNGNIKKAIKMYAVLCEENPDNSELMSNYISLLISEKNYESATENFAIFKRKFPTDVLIKDFEKKLNTDSKDDSPSSSNETVSKKQ